MELMDAVDEYIPTRRDTDKPFVMPVEDVFSSQDVVQLQLVELRLVFFTYLRS